MLILVDQQRMDDARGEAVIDDPSQWPQEPGEMRLLGFLQAIISAIRTTTAP